LQQTLHSDFLHLFFITELELMVSISYYFLSVRSAREIRQTLTDQISHNKKLGYRWQTARRV